MRMLADTKGIMETFMSQLQINIQQGSRQSNRMPQMQPSRGKTDVCYGSQQTGHYLRVCPQKVSRPFNRCNRQNASSNKSQSPAVVKSNMFLKGYSLEAKTAPKN